MDRRGRRNAVGPFAFTIAGMHNLGFELHFRFQRTPSLVSSITMPFSCSSARISSERLKLRALLGLVALFDQGLNLRIGQSQSGCRRLSASLAYLRTSKSCQRLPEPWAASQRFSSETDFRPGRYSWPDILENRGQRFRRIQVVVHALFELADRPASERSRWLVIRPACKLVEASRNSKSRIRSMLLCGSLQPFEREVELLAVRH